MLNQPPKILYKYRVYNDLSLAMLTNNQIYFASPLDFNDPFDCLAHEGMVEDFRKGMEDVIAADAARRGLSSQQIKSHIEKINNDESMIQARAETDADFQSGLDYIKNGLGIVSLSSCNSSILMWAHYADFHKGFCIGFKDNCGMPPSAIHEVSYSATIDRSFLLNFFLNGDDSEEKYIEEYQKVGILTKYIDWKYEKEWRIFGEKGISAYDDSCISEIIFGLKMPQENRNRITSILHGKKIAYYEAVKSKRDFSVDIIPIASDA